MALRVDGARKFVLEELEKQQIGAPRRLELVREHKVLEWLIPALEELMVLPIQDIRAEEIEQMGWEVFCILARGKEAQAQQRSILAHLSIPRDINHFCKSAEDCQYQRQIWWWQVVAKKLLQPKNPISLKDCYEFLTSNSPAGLNEECHRELVQFLEGKGIFRLEMAILEGVKKAVESIYSI
ncbi:hypothetical protein NP233_g11407 [Leucocoprinus birnbaumii]|uniref:Uncharacterized protein n=1 Tax=Leucocoprinus birnbaumii TaxID=56174 RepID=A0AAD5VGV2_9AGAR|nr:hypothetical protein NP233_g11407 [Leucocoprinus birnbaumii]